MIRLPKRFWKHKELIYKYAKKYNIDPFLFTALIWQESGFNEKAESPVGAYGLCQLMPETAKGLGVDMYKVEENIKGGAMYLHNSFEIAKKKDYVNDNNLIDIILASYNAGWGAVDRYKGVPNYKETIDYVKNIKFKYRILKKEYSHIFGEKQICKIYYHDGKAKLILNNSEYILDGLEIVANYRED